MHVHGSQMDDKCHPAVKKKRADWKWVTFTQHVWTISNAY
jgi:hypothetical protein